MVAYLLKMIKSHSSSNSLRIAGSEHRETGFGNSAFKVRMPDKNIGQHLVKFEFLINNE